MDTRGKKTAAAVLEEVTREVDQWLNVLFNGRRKTGYLDLEASEMMIRSAMHRVGAAGITELLQFPVPPAEQRTLPCSCGHTAHYQELRSKSILTAVGRVEVSRPYYLCSHCHNGQFPADVELDIENKEHSPGVRRMQAVVGQETPFDHGRQQMKLLADLEVTSKAVERTAESIGADIAAREQQQIQRAVQLDLPIVVGKPVPILYVQMDGTGVPVVKKETVGRAGKTEGEPSHTREVKLGCVFTQTKWDEEGYPIRDPDSTTYTGAIETAEEFGKRLYLEAWNRGWSRAEKKVVIGDGAEWIWNLAEQHFPGAIQIVDLFHARQHLWDLARRLYPKDKAERAPGSKSSKTTARQGQNRGTSLLAPLHPSRRSRCGRKDPHRGRLLRQKCRTHALPQVPRAALVCRLWRYRGRLQDRNRLALQTVRDVLDCPRGQRHPRPALLPPQWRV